MEYKFKSFKINTEGDSHSKSIGLEIIGFPRGLSFSMSELQSFMDRRHGDESYLSELCGTARREPDRLFIDSGLSIQGDIACIEDLVRAHIDNRDVITADYEPLRTVLRPGHADLGAYLKYGREGLRPGGGEFSGRMTALVCAAGGIALQELKRRGITIDAYILEIGGCPCIFSDDEEEELFIERIEELKAAGDSLGGIVGCRISGLPGGLGGPGMEGLEGDFARAMLAIPSAKGIEFGSGFEGARMRGSLNNDEYFLLEGEIYSRTNKQGGISGGISTGMNINFNIAFKPVPSISCEQRTVDIETMEETVISIGGRHDLCIVPRVLPVVEAMAALVVLDELEEARVE